jgi:serine/threonine protein kinase
MRPCECLAGLELDEGWRVDSYIEPPKTSTGGHFSVGYLAKNKDGRSGYLKALDFSGALQAADPSLALEALTKAYNFERELLYKCREKRLDRVVTPVGAGKVQVPGGFRELGNVMYLIFDLATGDIRNEVARWKQFDLAWVLRSLHHSAVGLSQLHSSGIAHQDLKPSNLLVFPIEGTKLSDLGRASYMHGGSGIDALPVPGDPGYAPPEQWYGWAYSGDFSRRYIADLYLLGSLIFFYFLGVSATHAVVTRLIQKQGQQSTGSGFEQDLPYVQEAFAEASDDLRRSVESVAEDLSDEIVIIAQQLCEPDPRRRGDPTVLEASHRPKHDLQPYVSRFDRLARVAEHRMI